MSELVPTVDLAPFRLANAAARAATARAMDDACSRLGFVQVVGHGLPDPVLAAMLRETEALFALPLDEKLALVPARPGINRGYAPRASEALAYSLGHTPAAPDLFEAFNIGPDRVPDDAWHRAAPYDLFADNLWPAGLPGLRPALTAYFDAAVRVAHTLTDLFAAALALPDHWFRPFVDRSTLTLRVNHYQRAAGDPEPEPGQLGMGAHTDYGVVTVLYADPGLPGLQILGPDGRFHDVLPNEGALLVNLGDLTAQWTNDRWRSTVHRVLPITANQRRSAALFLDANYDACIECLPTCRSPAHPPKYPPVLAGEHLMSKLLGPRLLRPSDALDTTGERFKTL